jgi:hypothetical protein
MRVLHKHDKMYAHWRGNAFRLSENLHSETTEQVSIKYDILRVPKMLTDEFDFC